MPLKVLPAIKEGEGPFGVASVNGRSVPVFASVVDQLAALYGHGCRRKGDAKVTFGTGAFALVVAGHERPELPNGILPTVGWGRPEDVTLISNLQPDANISSAISTANEAPTAHPTIPKLIPPRLKENSCV